MEFQGTERFEVLSYLGEGTMGVVYCCRDHERNENVAVKTLRDLDGEALFRFKNEFRAIQGLQHINLVSLGELIEVDGSWFFTMELVDGQDFLSHVRLRARTVPARAAPGANTDDDQGDCRPPTTCDLDRLRPALRQLAEGLTALHLASKVHRDIKPSNVLVTREGRVVILDFGFVTTVESQPGDPVGERPGAHEIVGTAAYMAPEQASTAHISPAADWYAVGIILFEALVGHPPIEGSSMEVLMAKQHREVKRPSEYVTGVPEELDTLCTALLAIEPERRPHEDKILALLGGQRLSLRSITAGSMSIRQPEFVGRMDELRVLDEAYDSTDDGRATAVFVLGESGIGKSALVERFTRELASAVAPPVILIARCHERESVPYKAFDGVIDALSRYLMDMPAAEIADLLPDSIALLATIFPVLRRVESIALRMDEDMARVDPAEQRAQVFQSVRELLHRVRARHRLILVIDDLQWADGDSVALLSHLLRTPDEPALMLIGTVRTTEEGILPTSPMAVLGRVLQQTREIRLHGLPETDARRLADILFRQLAPHRTERAGDIVAESGGHPLFIDEMIRFVLASGETELESLHLEDALAARIAGLAPDARDVLEHLAVASEPISRAIAASAVKMTVGEFTRWLRVLRVANLVRTSSVGGSDSVELFHDRVRMAAIRNIPVSRRRHCHERLALALEMASGGRPEALAMHWRRAGNGVKAYRYLLLAAEEAERALAFDRAANLYRQSLELLAADAPDAPEVKARLGAALANAGRAPESANAFLSAAKYLSRSGALPGGRGDRRRAVDLHARAAGQLLRSGHVDSGLEVLGEVLLGLGMTMPLTPRGALTSLLLQRARIRVRGLRFRERTEPEVPEQILQRTDIAWEVSIGLGIIDTIRGAEFQAKHLLLALKTGEPYRVARALAVEAAYRYTAGYRGHKSAERVLAGARALAKKLDHPHVHALSDLMAGIGAVLLGRWREAIKLCDSAERILRARCHNVAWETDSARIIRMWGQWYIGALHVMNRRMPELMSSAQARGDLYAETSYRSYFLPMLLLVQDRPRQAHQEGKQAMKRWSQQGFHFQHYFHLFAATQIDLYLAEYQSAMDRIDAQWAALSRSMLLQVQQNRIEAMHFRARCELALGRQRNDDKLVALAARRADRIRGEKTGWGDGLADLIAAGVADARADRERCVHFLTQAVAGLKRHDMYLYAAAASRILGRYQGDERGDEIATEADAWLAKERVKSPGRMAAMLVPGIDVP